VAHSIWALATSEAGQNRPILRVRCMSDPPPRSRIVTPVAGLGTTKVRVMMSEEPQVKRGQYGRSLDYLAD
jgi:hypothetical protein